MTQSIPHLLEIKLRNHNQENDKTEYKKYVLIFLFHLFSLFLGIENLKGKRSNDFRVFSNYDKTFVYEVGNIVEVNDFDTNRWKESTTGIHFFMNKIDIDISEGYFF